MPDPAPPPVKVKICGLRRREDVLAADRFGADYLGVVLSSGFGRSIAPECAAALVAGTRATRVAVLVDEGVDAAIALGRALGAGVLQLHGNEGPDVVRLLGEHSSWRIWKSVRARHPDDLLRAVDVYGALVGGILIEGYLGGVVGGGGAALDLDAFAETRTRIPSTLQVVLAGGLTAENVGDAVARFTPDVVDVSSGVERVRGEKDPDLVRRFIAGARGGVDAPTSNSRTDTQGETR